MARFRSVGVAVAIAVGSGCNGLVTTSAAGDGSGGGSAPGSDPSSSAGAPLSPSVDPCTLTSFDVRAERDAALERGPIVIRGIVLTSKPVTRIEIAVGIGAASWAYGAMVTARGDFPTPRSEISFEIVGLPLPTNPEKGGFNVRALADQNDDGLMDENDLAGWFAGTTAKPALQHEAELIALGPERTSTCNVVFGIGPVTCSGAWGTPCAKDTDCRPTVCDCADGSKLTGTYEACSPTTKTCQRTPTADCTGMCGAGNIVADRAADCSGK